MLVLDYVQAKVTALPLASLGNFGQEVQSQMQEELDALSSSPSVASGIPSAPQRTAGATIGRGVQR